ncbi:hypothetical protein BHM03_00054499, partial [Ensete ventricosum]
FPYRSVQPVPGGTSWSARLSVCGSPAISGTAKVDRRRSISAFGGRLREKKGRRRRRRKEEEKKNTSRCPRLHAIAARGSPVSRRRPRAIFLPRGEKDRGDGSVEIQGHESQPHSQYETYAVQLWAVCQ